MNVGWKIFGIVLVCLFVLRVGLSVVRRPSDQEQIRTALQESIDASRSGKPGGLLDLLGNDLTVNSQEVAGSSGEIADFIKKQHPAVTFENLNPTVSGSQAQIESGASIDLNFLGQHRTFHLAHVLLIFKKEAATTWYVIPTEKWKLQQVLTPNFSPDELTG